MRGFCLNWKVVGGLGAVGLGVYTLTPNLWEAAVPLLIAAACPLSMLFMMGSMRGGMNGQCSTSGASTTEDQQTRQAGQSDRSPAVQIAALKQELTEAQARQEAIARQIASFESETAPAVREAQEVAHRASQTAQTPEPVVSTASTAHAEK